MSAAPVVIVGGGMSGLAAAYELAGRSVPFLLLEAAPAVGGVVKTERIDGFVVDAGPDALVTQKPAAIDLCRELGLSDRLRPQMQRGAFLVRGGALRALPEASVFGIPVDWPPFVLSRAFSLRGKLRMAAEYAVPGRPQPATNRSRRSSGAASAATRLSISPIRCSPAFTAATRSAFRCRRCFRAFSTWNGDTGA